MSSQYEVRAYSEGDLIHTEYVYGMDLKPTINMLERQGYLVEREAVSADPLIVAWEREYAEGAW